MSLIGMLSVPFARADDTQDAVTDSHPPRVCAFIADNAANGDVLSRQLSDTGKFDVNNDGVDEIVEYGVSGTAHASFHDVTFDSGETRRRFAFRDAAAEDWLRHAYRPTWLPFEGHVYRVYFGDEIGPFPWAVARLAPDNLQDVICRFQTDIVETLSAPSGNPLHADICRWFDAGASGGRVAFNARPAMSIEELGRISPGSRHFPIGRSQLDFDNDGQTEDILAIIVSSGAGRGYDLDYFELTDPDGSGLLIGRERDLLLVLQDVNLEDTYPHRRFRGTSQFVRYRGVTYFEARYHATMTIGEDDLHHWVRSIDGSDVVTICEADYSFRISVR